MIKEQFALHLPLAGLLISLHRSRCHKQAAPPGLGCCPGAGGISYFSFARQKKSNKRKGRRNRNATMASHPRKPVNEAQKQGFI
jgi:hypothetical protein